MVIDENDFFMKTRKFQVAFFATIIWFIFMTYLSHQNGEETTRASSRLMKLFWFLDAGQIEIVSSWTRRGAHVFCFMILTVLLMKLLRIAKLQPWIGVLVVCVWCFFDEWTKRSIPGRHYSTFDVMLNAAGVLLGWLISRGRLWHREERALSRKQSGQNDH